MRACTTRLVSRAVIAMILGLVLKTDEEKANAKLWAPSHWTEVSQSTTHGVITPTPAPPAGPGRRGARALRSGKR